MSAAQEIGPTLSENVRRQANGTDSDARWSRISRRRLLGRTAALVAAAAVSSSAAAPPVAKRPPRVGVLSINPRRVAPGLPEPPAKYLADAFVAGLLELGYEDGKTIQVEFAEWEGEPERQRAIAAELAARGVDIFVAYGTEAQRAAKATTSTVPIVMFSGNDPIAAGLIPDLAGPGGNITGVANDSAVMTAKRLELLKDSFPNVSRVAIVSDDAASRKVQRRAAEQAARALRLEVMTVEGRLRSELAQALDTAGAAGANSLLVLGNVPGGSGADIVAFAAALRIPGVYPNKVFVENGGLMTYTEDEVDLARRVAGYVVRILGGERPADMPIEQPTKFDTIINLTIARASGLMIPQHIMGRATRVIE